MEQIADYAPVVQILDTLVPQMVDQLVAVQLVDVLTHFDSLVTEQVIAVPKISWPSLYPRTVLREPQKAEQSVLQPPIVYQAGEKDPGAVALVLDLAKAFERVSLLVVWAWATHFSFPRKILRVLCGYFEHQRRVQFEGCVAEPLQTITAIMPGSKWSCLLLRIVLKDALSEVTKIFRHLKLRVFVDDITAL